MEPKLGYIGIGQMGKPMVLRLLAAGHEVTVWNRSRDKVAPVVEKGAKAASSPAEVARAADIIMMCVTNQNAAEAIMLKDLENAAKMAREFGVPLTMARTAAKLYRMLKAQGKGEKDPAVLIELLSAKV